MIPTTIFLALILIVSFLLILTIMVQNPKSGGLSSSFGGSNQIGGVQKTTDFLEKATWTLAGVLVLLVMFTNISYFSNSGKSNVDDGKGATTIPNQVEKPATETPATNKPAAKPEGK